MSLTSPTSLTIAHRFAGPPTSANGGYTAGMLAAQVSIDDPVTVTLRRPPPLGVPLTVAAAASPPAQHDNGATMQLLDGDTLIADAAVGAFAGEPVEQVRLDVARRAQSSYRGLRHHPFPACFACGPDRAVGDGLRLQPGPVGPGRTACIWVPSSGLAHHDRPEVTATAYVWAALDCPGGWTSDLASRPLVLGRMTAVCHQAPAIGCEHVVVARLTGADGRKCFTAAALYDAEGRLLGRAEHTWIAIDPAAFAV